MKRIIYLACGIISFSLLFICHSASALEFDPDASFTGTFKTGTCYYRNAIAGENTYDDTFSCNHGGKGNLGGFTIVSEQTLPKNSLLLIPITVQSLLGSNYDFNQFLAVSELSKASIFDLSSVQSGGYFGTNNNIHCAPGVTCDINVFENVLYLKVFIQEDTTSVRFQINSEGGFHITHPRTYNLIKLSDSAKTQQDINDNIQQGNQAEQDRYDQGKNEADDSKNNAQSSSDQSQSQADSDSANLWQIINTFKDTVVQSEPGHCTISGDFGFFDAGSIDICTGGAAFRPITTIVGTIMLLFFTFTSAISLVNSFLQLYNESLRS